ncbi:MAG: Rrf2 family transcriptional regulator [Planctomycetes bacterium]|nr:Rrf2 family transcriptional regulator [Planctomycetota bacterium]
MRQLRQSSEYAIRALTYLALRASSDFVVTERIARELGLPQHYLAKLLKPFVDRGVLLSRRGRLGGFRMNRAPEQLTLQEIVAVHEPPTALRACMLGPQCPGPPDECPLHELNRRLAHDLEAVLRVTTLADLVRYCSEHSDSGYPSGAIGAARPSMP